MGEQAEMEIFAHMRGKSSADLSAGDMAEFYQEYDEQESKPRVRFRCACGRRLKSDKALLAHRRDKGCKA